MRILDGRIVSKERRAKILARATEFRSRFGRSPKLAVVIVGDHLASQVYVRNKIKACQEVGLTSQKVAIPSTVGLSQFKDLMSGLEADEETDGILVQLPLPSHLRELDLGEFLSAAKDADGFTYATLGKVGAGRSRIAPCTPQGIMSILAHYQIAVAGLHCVVVGRSLIVGKPMSWLLTDASATVTLCHSRTKDLRSFTRQADLVVVAAGQQGFLGREDFRQGSVVIDVGMHGSGEGKGVCGDVRFAELAGWVEAATPVPGGVGPMTITTLLENTLLLAEARQAISSTAEVPKEPR
ncbi:MAG: bifunctional methylenetetrahydrofolate dehydrogenase/methenyltetrahydrofolate cyclohydrolase [Bdellovibrio sp.]|nr:MAG: bifunctional methylenetetrahydrofolate dehydrogenase/methenyltetrahydrofolate cyclohydrolase [Bdellovibrio sp.]